MPRVSVIMPTYNRDWVIKRAIDSVLKQTESDLELIIIDDGSTDHTSDVLSTIEDSRIIFLKIEHKGVAAARNTGILRAKSEIIAYLDSDNVWHHQFLEVLLEELREPYVMVYCSQNTFLVSGNQIIGRRVRNESFNPARLLLENYIEPNAVIHRRVLFEEVGLFDETLTIFEDWDFFVRVVSRYPFGVKHIDQVLGDYYYFLRGTAETLTNSFIDDDSLLYFFRKYVGTGMRERVLFKIRKNILEMAD